MQTIFLTLTWIALILLRSLRFRASGLSQFELNRRLASHDDSVRSIIDRERVLPLLGALQLLASGLVAVLLVALATLAYGVLLGAILSLPLLYLAEFVGTRQRAQKMTTRLLGRFEPQFLKLAETLRGLLTPLVSLRGMTSSQAFYSKEELSELIANDSSILSADEKKLLQQGLKFESIKIGDVMTPRSVIDTVEVNETLGPVVLDRLHKTGHSRFPVIDRDLDHVVGMLFLHDLVPLDPKLKRARDGMSHKVYYVHQDRNLEHALHAFLRTKHHLFIVVNDFSEVVGLVTIEDCLEQILGRKIVDEFDAYDDLRAVAVRAASKKPETGEVV